MGMLNDSKHKEQQDAVREDHSFSYSKLNLRQEKYEPILSQPMEMALLDTEVLLSVFSIDGPRKIRTCYGDVRAIVDALMDYSRVLRQLCDEWELHGFQKVMYEMHADDLKEIADKLQKGIGYDYNAAMERCQKQKEKREQEDGPGGEAMAMAYIRKQQVKKKSKEK